MTKLVQTPELRATALAGAEIALWDQIQGAAVELEQRGCPVYACAFLPVNDKAMELPYTLPVTTKTMEAIRQQKVNMPVQLYARYYETHQMQERDLAIDQLPKLPATRTKGGDLQAKLRQMLKRLCNRDLKTRFKDNQRASFSSLDARLNISWPAELGTHHWYETHKMRLGLLHWFFDNEDQLRMIPLSDTELQARSLHQIEQALDESTNHLSD